MRGLVTIVVTIGLGLAAVAAPAQQPPARQVAPGPSAPPPRADLPEHREIVVLQNDPATVSAADTFVHTSSEKIAAEALKQCQAALGPGQVSVLSFQLGSATGQNSRGMFRRLVCQLRY